MIWSLAQVFTMACTQQAPPAPDTRAADVKAVQNLEAALVKDIATKDADKVANYFLEDGSDLLPNMPVITGRENIKAAWKQALADPNFSLTFQSTRAEASKGGDLAYTMGTYSMTTSAPKGRKPVTDKGKYLTVFQKQADGTWKVVADMSSSDLPAAGATK
jgi:uncharacterized protein (TIGR02246 family)